MTQPFTRWPPSLGPNLGSTAVLPDGMQVGQAAQRALNNLVNWRFDGIHMMSAGWRPNSATNDDDGKFYPIMHYPPRADAEDRGIAIGWTIWGTIGGVWYLKYQDAVAGYAQETIADSGGNVDPATTMTEDMVPTWSGVYPTVYKPPSAGAANLHQGNFKALEIETQNIYCGTIAIWHIEEESSLPDAQVAVKLADVAPGKIISENDNSLAGLHEWIGTGADNVESYERLSRRVFFNEAHVTGINIAAGTAWTNIVGNHVYPAWARDFEYSTSERYCYPAMVITTDGVDATHTATIRYTSTCAANNVWTYTVQNAEPDNTPYIITPAMAGASSASGVRVESESQDVITVEAMTDSGVTLTIHSWALFEGPAW